MRRALRSLFVLVLMSAFSAPASADSTLFSTNPDPDGAMGMASRPGVGGKTEIETGDDFFTTSNVRITSATFTGLLTGTNPTIGDVVVELYHIFPLDSGPFDGKVPTRNNSPSDVAFDSRDTAGGTLSFTTTTLSSDFSASNSVLNGISVNSGGDGAIRGTEVQFTVTFSTPFSLTAGSHDFFVPQVQVDGGEFYWLSSARPIVAPGTPFPAGTTDLQAWIRNEALQPDWLRVGTDIIGGTTPPTFNGTFSLSGNAVPEPSTFVMAGIAVLTGLGGWLRRRTRPAGTTPA